MRLKKYPYNSIRERKGNLSMFYSFFSQRIQYRYWISCFLSKLPPKKVLIFDDKNIFIGFDSVVFCISIQNLRVNMLNIDGIFFDIYLLENQKICIIHELGAIITDKKLTRENSVSTDIISDWEIDKVNKLIILTELDSEKIISLNYD